MSANHTAGESPLEALVERSKAGEHPALEELVVRIQDRIYGLALRMLWHPSDAEDATQEILVRIITRLGSFRGESSFSTWAYRVASNYLLTTRKRRMEMELTFESFGADLDRGLAEAADSAASPEDALLVEEVKIGCTHGMLLCLDREHRLTFILGEVFELTDRVAAEVLEISPAAFRKRLSRARQRLYDFMRRKCGLVNRTAACRCARRVDRAVELGRVDSGALLFAGHAGREHTDPSLRKRVAEMEELHREAAIFRGHPDFAAPATLIAGIRKLIRSDRFRIIST